MDEQQAIPECGWEYAPPTGTSIRLAPGSTYRVTVPAGWKIAEAEYAGGIWTYILTVPMMPSAGEGKQ